MCIPLLFEPMNCREHLRMHILACRIAKSRHRQCPRINFQRAGTLPDAIPCARCRGGTTSDLYTTHEVIHEAPSNHSAVETILSGGRAEPYLRDEFIDFSEEGDGSGIAFNMAGMNPEDMMVVRWLANVSQHDLLTATQEREPRVREAEVAPGQVVEVMSEDGAPNDGPQETAQRQAQRSVDPHGTEDELEDEERYSSQRFSPHRRRHSHRHHGESGGHSHQRHGESGSRPHRHDNESTSPTYHRHNESSTRSQRRQGESSQHSHRYRDENRSHSRQRDDDSISPTHHRRTESGGHSQRHHNESSENTHQHHDESGSPTQQRHGEGSGHSRRRRRRRMSRREEDPVVEYETSFRYPYIVPKNLFR